MKFPWFPGRFRLHLLALALALAVALPVAAFAADYTVDAGRESATVSFDAMFPSVTYIHVGDTITFKNAAKFTPHTVTFAGGATLPNPQDMAAVAAPTQPSGGSWAGQGLLNSGLMEPGATYAVTFTQVGVYDYLCLLHPLMQGQVVVLPAGAPIPSAEDQAKKAEMEHHDHMAQADLAAANLQGRLPQGKVNDDGSVTWTVVTGTGLSHFTVNQFYPAQLVVSEGDSVTFPNQNMYEFHFVSFPTSPDDAAKFFGPMGPNLEAMMTPMGGTVVDGSQLINSGGIFPGQSKTFSFPKAGTYHYVCFIHGGSKMEGDIVVLPKDSVHVYINGQPVAYNGHRQPHMHGDHAYISVAEFFKALGGSVAWDSASKTLTAVTSGTAQATAGQGEGIQITVNGKPLAYGYDPQPHIHDGKVYAPAQALVDALGGRMQWDAATRTLMIEVR